MQTGDMAGATTIAGAAATTVAGWWTPAASAQHFLGGELRHYRLAAGLSLTVLGHESFLTRDLGRTV